MTVATLTTPHQAAHTAHCSLCCRRERSLTLVASGSRPFTDIKPRRRSATTLARVAEPATLEQSDSQPRNQADEPRRRSVDNAELNQLARMMPDPAEDELIDDGRSDDFGREGDKQLFQQQGLPSDLLLQGDRFLNSNYIDQYDQDLGFENGDYGYPDDLQEEMPDLDPREIELGLAQAQFNYDARKRWELEQAELRALELHHKQAESGVNRFAQATVLAQIMQHIEETDMLAGLESTATPSWVRAHFRLEDMWDEFSQQVHEMEQQRNQAESTRIEEDAMLMLDGDESLWRDEYDDSPLEPAAAVRPKAANSQDRRPARGAKLEEDASLDKYLGRMPGVGDMDSEESVMNEMLGPEAAGDDNVDEDDV